MAIIIEPRQTTFPINDATIRDDNAGFFFACCAELCFVALPCFVLTLAHSPLAGPRLCDAHHHFSPYRENVYSIMAQNPFARKSVDRFAS